MRAIRTKAFFLVSLFLLALPQNIYPDNKVKNIVILFTLSPNIVAYQNILEGFRSNINVASDASYNILTEFLDVGRFPDENHIQFILDEYNEKFRDTGIDLLIIVGTWAYPLLKKYDFGELKNSKTIIIDNENLIKNSDQITVSENALEINLKYKFGKTIKTDFEFFPDYKNVYIISGCSATDKYYSTLCREEAKAFKDSHNFTFISDLSFDSTLLRVKEIPSNSIVIVTSFLSDKDNIPFSTPEAIRIIANYSKAPVFNLYDSFVKSSGIGGYIYSYYNVGKETGRAATEILNGKLPKDITINENNFYRNIYDWQQLKKWNLQDSKLIPANSVFLNKEFSVISEYGWQILILFLFLIFEALLIIFLFKLIRRQKLMINQKIEIDNLQRVLIREDRMLRMVELTASLSHELNQPLTAILYNAQAGMRFLKSDKLDRQQTEEIFENIIEDDKRAAGLISSIRSLMKLETRDKEKVNLNTLIKDTVTLFRSEAIQQQIKITLNLHEDPVYVLGDKIQLQQVIVNFILNAFKAMENIEPENRKLEINQLLNTSSVVVSVRDSGTGINESIKEKLFNAFVTSHKSGFGIGLAVCKTIIENHHGKIWADNLKNGGAEFSFKLEVFKDEK